MNKRNALYRQTPSYWYQQLADAEYDGHVERVPRSAWEMKLNEWERNAAHWTVAHSTPGRVE